MAALYRRYRPETFEEVIGQTHVTEPLRHSLAASKTHHAYLFSGPRGCGKTTSARILARCLNCAHGPTETPCGTCASCTELARDGGGSLDVVEIDAASHNGVDDARELRERAVFAPVRDRYKIFILDEAHMVTQQGFNALLKIVEEPPEHVKFIFATTEPEKVLATIRSRTHHYPFRLVPPGELLNYLEMVVRTEGVSVERGVLALVVESGEGSVRDSLSILDQLIAGKTGETVSLSSAQELLGYTPRMVLNDTVDAIAKKNPNQLFQVLSQAIESGLDPRRFVEDLLSHIRDLIVSQATGESGFGLFTGASEDDLATLQEQSGWFSPTVLSEIASATAHSLSEMSGVTSPKLQLELLAARLLSLARQSPIHEDEHTGRHRPAITEKLPALAMPEDFSTEKRVPAEASEASRSVISQEASSEGFREPIKPWSIEILLDLWPSVIDELAQQKRSLWVSLSRTKPVSLVGDVLTIGFEKRRDAEVLKKPQGPGSPLPNADLLRDAIFRHSGHRMRFTVTELEDGPSSELKLEVSGHASHQEHSSVTAEKVPPTTPLDAKKTELDSAEFSLSDELTSTSDSPIASRGEPVVRQLLGGELVSEEILGSMSDQGESDV